MDHLRFIRIYCASDSLEIWLALAWRVFGVTWHPFHKLRRLCVFPWKLHSVFSGCYGARFIGVSLEFFGALIECIMGAPLHDLPTISFLGKSSSLGELHGLVNRLVRAFLFGAGWFHHTLRHISAWRTSWPSQSTCINCQAWYYRHWDLFQSSDQICRSDILLKWRPSSLWLTDVSVPVISRLFQRIRENYLFLSMIIYHP